MSERQRTRRKRRGIRTGLALAGLAVAAGGLLGPRAAERLREHARHAPFVLESIAVVGAHRVQADAVAEATGLSRGAPLVDLDLQEVELRVEALLAVEDARSMRLPPRRLVVGVTERTPRGWVDPVRPGQPARVVCDDGVPFGPASRDELDALPHLRVAGTAPSGEAHPGLAEAVTLAARLAARGLDAVEIALSRPGDPTGAAVRLRGVEPSVVLGWDPDEEALDRLTSLTDRHAELLAGVRELDLRFAGGAVLRRGVERAPGGAQPAAGTRGGAGPPTKPTTG